MSHVLIIEDELLLAFSVEEALRQLGYSSFEIASTMALAIQAAEKRCPDLIIADHRITGGTGTDAVQAICSEKTIPVVFVTSSEREVRQILPDAFIVSKPPTRARLEAAINAALERPFRHSPGGETPTLRIVE